MVVVVGIVVVVVGELVVVVAIMVVVVGPATEMVVTGGVLASAELQRRNVAEPVTRPPTNTTRILNVEDDTATTQAKSPGVLPR
jgi:hypothetical protein